MNQLRVVIAPDSFKGTVSAQRAGEALSRGWLSERPLDRVTIVPLADGGEGTLDAIEAALPDSVRCAAGPVAGPDRRSVPGEWLRLPDGTAVIELAQMNGLPLMRTPDARGASSLGLGQVIRAAIEAGSQRLVVGLGGSASTDGGAGALSALGLRAIGGSLSHGGGGLSSLRSLDRSDLISLPPDGVVLLTDVDSPLFGESGAATVFAPQKGATPGQIVEFDAALRHFASLLGGDPNRPGSGAAGGVGFGLASWGAIIRPGAAWLMDLAGIDEKLRNADVVLTGEGRFDSTSSTGKLVGQLISRGTAAGATFGVIAGSIAEQPRTPDGAALWATALVGIAGSVASAQAEPERWLELAGAAAARSELRNGRQAPATGRHSG